MNCVSSAFDLQFFPLIRGYHGDFETMLDAPGHILGLGSPVGCSRGVLFKSTFKIITSRTECERKKYT